MAIGDRVLLENAVIGIQKGSEDTEALVPLQSGAGQTYKSALATIEFTRRPVNVVQPKATMGPGLNGPLASLQWMGDITVELRADGWSTGAVIMPLLNASCPPESTDDHWLLKAAFQALPGTASAVNPCYKVIILMNELPVFSPGDSSSEQLITITGGLTAYNRVITGDFTTTGTGNLVNKATWPA